MTDGLYEAIIIEIRRRKSDPPAGRTIGGEVFEWCPFHPDGCGKPPHSPSLRLNRDKEMWYCDPCNEGGTLTGLAERLGLRVNVGHEDRIVAVYDYLDATGDLWGQVCRKANKDFKVRRPDGNGGWIWNWKGVTRTLYRLPELLAADPDERVFVVEGEKDADRLASLGLVATTNPGGAGKWRDEYSDSLKGRRVALIPDHDDAGLRHVPQVAASLAGKAADVRFVDLPAEEKGDDVSDWLDRGHTAKELLDLAEETPSWQPHSGDGGVSSVSSPKGFPPNGLPPVPPFPVEVLPEASRQLVGEGASAIGVPPDLIAVPHLVFAGATIGNAHSIEIKPGFVQRPILFAACVAPPGAAKSPALDLARDPLDVLQEEARRRFKDELRDYERKLKTWQSEKGEQKPDRPQMEHFFSTDSTTEALAMMLTSSAGFALVRDEFVGWVKSFDAYRGGRGGDRQNWLSVWSGAPLKVDRKSSDTVYVPDPVVCVCGGAQPEMLPELADEAGRRDGFIERILWSYPDTPSSDWTEATVASQTKNAVVAVFGKLRFGTHAESVRLSVKAKGLWVSWYNENARLVDQAVGLLSGVFAKLPNQAARLALILHCLRHPSSPESVRVSAETMSGALELAEYFRAHACRAMAHFGVAAIAPSGGLAARAWKILSDGNGDWVDRTGLHTKLGGHVPADALDRALSDLQAIGLAELLTVPSGPSGGRPTELWRGIPHSEETEETPPPACYACGGTARYRRPDGSGPVCATCHPPPRSDGSGNSDNGLKPGDDPLGLLEQPGLPIIGRTRRT